MFAVVVTGGKQYKVRQGDTLKVESLPLEEGQSFDFDKVLMLSDGKDIKMGNPLVAGAKVSAKVLGHGRGKKIEIIKFKRRKHHMKRQGHRQNFTEIEVTGVA